MITSPLYERAMAQTIALEGIISCSVFHFHEDGLIFCFHELSHSHVSLLIDMGFSPHLIAERIGDTVQMVNRTYGHLYPDRHGEVAEQLERMIVPK